MCAEQTRFGTLASTVASGRLDGEHVERRAAQPAFAQRVKQRGLVDDPAARGVDE